MTIEVRAYDVASDYPLVDRFLIEIYRPGPHLVNWLQPRWEYMHSHPDIAHVPLDRIGVAEADGAIVGLVHIEHDPAIGFIQVRPGFEHVKQMLVEWAETHLGGWSQSLERHVVGIYVNEHDPTLRQIVATRGMRRIPELDEHHSRFLLHDDITPRALPPGYRLLSLEDENDVAKSANVLWTGFDHQGAMPSNEVAVRQRAQQTANFRKDLTIVAAAPNGSFVSYAGMWVVEENRVAYVEPVATDPDHRRIGLGSACVTESLRRAYEAGARVAWVGSDLEFYRAIGFETVNSAHLWVRDFTPSAD